MKKFLSVFSLYIRSSVYKLIAVIILMTAAQIVLFNKTLNSDYATAVTLTGIESLTDVSRVQIVFAAAFLAVTVFLILSGSEFGTKQGYTLRRLCVKEKSVLLCQATANTLLYAVLLISEILISYVLCMMYMKFAETPGIAEKALISNQTVFLAYYRSNFLHALLPLDDILKHISNLVALLGMGFTSAVFPYFLRRKRVSLEVFILMFFIFFNFSNSWTTSSGDVVIIGASFFLTGIAVARLGAEVKAYD